MIQLPRNKRDPKETEKLCLCRPICKNRRREWDGQVLNTSAELLLERKPVAECVRRWPKKVYPNGPCPLFGRTRHVTIKEKNTFEKRDVVRICQAPVDDQVDTPYLRYAEMAKKLGILNQVVSEWVRCILSVLCCQCGKTMPLSKSTSAYSQDICQTKEPAIEIDRACGEPLVPHHVTIDFTPTKADTEQTTTRCIQFWEFVKSQRELEGIMVTSEPLPPLDIEDKSAPIQKQPTSKKANQQKDSFRSAVTIINEINNNGVIDAVFRQKD